MTLSDSFQILDLIIPESSDPHFQLEPVDNRLRNLNKLNIFIGPNNSGKSRFLRHLFHNTEPWFVENSAEAHETINLERTLTALLKFGTDGAQKDRVTELIETALTPPINATGKVQNQQTLFDYQAAGNAIQSLTDFFSNIDSFSNSSDRAIDIARGLIARLRGAFRRNEDTNYKFTRIYIPSLRGLRPLQGNPYHDKANQYFGGKYKSSVWDVRDYRTSPNIITGLELYEYARMQLLGDWEQRKHFAEFENFLSTHFYNGERVSLVPRVGHDELHLKIGAESEFPIRDLGDGIAQIVILTLPIFLFQDTNLLLFIEEPELYLHPGYQRILAEVFLDKNIGAQQVFITTHSTSFLDLTLEQDLCSVYRVSKHKNTSSDESNSKYTSVAISMASNDDLNLLAELGIRNSSLFLSNCTIWVEGITDRLYFQHYLDLYNKHAHKKIAFFEDVHYSFVEYGGNNITHWSFLGSPDETINVKRLCGELMLIADSDSGKEKRHNELRITLGDRYIKLPCREIENLLTPETLYQVVLEYEGSENETNIKRPSSHTAYRDRKIGNYIQDKMFVEKDQSIRKKKSQSGNGYADSSGAIKDKVQFCRKAIAHLESWEELSEEAQSVTQRIIEFIAEHNP